MMKHSEILLAGKSIFFAILIALLFAGCGSKNYYKPQKVDGKVTQSKTVDSKIVDVSRDGATYDNGQVVVKDIGILDLNIPKGFTFVNSIDSGIIITSKSGDAKILSNKNEILFQKNFDKQLVSASLKDNLLAMVFIDNEIMLYDIKDDKIQYKQSLSQVLTIDARAANPIFLDNLLLFATLDGRVLIMSLDNKTVVRDVSISNKEFFNNVIFLDNFEDTLVAATASKIISVNKRQNNTLNLDIKDIVYQDKNIYVFTKNGEVILLDESLKKEKELKFTFGHFVGVALGEKLYVVEKRGYLIEIEKDLSSYRVLKLPNEVDGSLFFDKNKIYFDNYYIEIK